MPPRGRPKKLKPSPSKAEVEAPRSIFERFVNLPLDETEDVMGIEERGLYESLKTTIAIANRENVLDISERVIAAIDAVPRDPDVVENLHSIIENRVVQRNAAQVRDKTLLQEMYNTARISARQFEYLQSLSMKTEKELEQEAMFLQIARNQIVYELNYNRDLNRDHDMEDILDSAFNIRKDAELTNVLNTPLRAPVRRTVGGGAASSSSSSSSGARIYPGNDSQETVDTIQG